MVQFSRCANELVDVAVSVHARSTLRVDNGLCASVLLDPLPHLQLERTFIIHC
jgi:hypothetical protein